jgi:hypothetical protein
VGKGSRKGSSAGRDGLSGPKFTTSGRMSVDSPRISSMSELKLFIVDFCHKNKELNNINLIVVRTCPVERPPADYLAG